MMSFFYSLEEKFNALLLNERRLIAISVIAVVYGIWHLTFYSSHSDKYNDLTLTMEAKKEYALKINSEKSVFAEALTSNVDANKKRKIIQLVRELASIDERLEKLSVGLVPSEKLVDILQQVIVSIDNPDIQLKITYLTAHSPVNIEFPINIENDMQVSDGRSSSENGIDGSLISDLDSTVLSLAYVYEHAVTLKLKGDYFSLLTYLSALESLPWKLYWEYLEYKVDKHPEANVVLKVYTLSTSKGSIGN